MDDLNIIDQFMTAFIRYIDSGFGLLGGDVRFLTATLIAIDVTLAGLFWALAGEDNVLGRFIRKVLYVGAFAFIINSFSALADIIFRSFAQAGITAGGGSLTTDDLLRPGRLAGTGFSAAWPLLEQAGKLLTVTSFFQNALQIVVLLLAWLLVILAFFILAVQMFVCIIEFKLVGLAGFILVPFALWNRTSFLAERVLGHIVSSGIKVMVLAVIVGIGSNFFDQFTQALQGQEPDVGQAMSLVLASLALFGLGIFAPSVASGLASGAPQLGAGAAAGTVLGAGGVAMLAGGGAVAGARLAGTALTGIRAGTSMGASASVAGSRSHGGPGHAGPSGGHSAPSGGAGHPAAPSKSGPSAPQSSAGTSSPNSQSDNSNASSSPSDTTAESGEGTPQWAKTLRAEQTARHRRDVAIHAVQQGDRGGGSTTPDISERND
ncbi:P-type conjugative transfer protein TrbL [Novosphingobium sp. RL4]|uniref:P-type conjugative transfer protein TrbL n=1 Tax=Novosphingobium sp. RL4 TaxID=3109595 RepID=UPI002D767EF3|nr:P-type conjugative transfer protein TrbL [Novosphingobium sp. RL4]WRT94496.1 P-type conjugative transfer protein TrbL [Novosphingobium sp. RL4]